MSLTTKMYEGSKEIWDRYLVHPFVLEMARGELPLEKYKRYMLEDYVYLKEYIEILKIGMNRTKNPDEIRYLENHINETIEETTRVHVPYMKSLGITDSEIESYPQSNVLKEYTDYMKGIASQGDFLDVISVILSCSWSYAFICEYMKTNGCVKENSAYEGWFDAYSCEAYQSANETLIEMVEMHGKDKDREEKLCSVFRKCSEHELNFWDYLYD